MIKVNVKKMINMHIPLALIVKIGDVTINEKHEVRCKSRDGVTLEVNGEWQDGFPSLVVIKNIFLDGLNRGYERDFKNLCAWSMGEIYAIISVNNGEKLLKFKSINGEMYEEEITVEINS